MRGKKMINILTIKNRRWKCIREVSSYLIIGGMTTLVNWVVYFMSTRLIGIEVIAATILSWICAVAFAYVANRSIVFQSKESNIGKEFCGFAISRLFSMIVEITFLAACVYVLNWNDLISKLVIAVIVVIVNYFTSKFIVFAKKGNGNEK